MNILNLFKRKAERPPLESVEHQKDLYIDFDIWPGHKVYEYDKESDTVKLATVEKKVFANKTVHIVKVNGPQFIYVSALNPKGAKKKCCKH